MGGGGRADDLVWYGAYGSNLDLARFSLYLEGGVLEVGGARAVHRGARDPAPPRASRAATIPHALHFARRSTRWDGGGVAFVARTPLPGVATTVRQHLITLGQLEDVVAQENGQAAVALDLDTVTGLADGGAVRACDGWYGTVLRCGTVEGRPVLTFTDGGEVGDVPPVRPSEGYLRTIAAGLHQTAGLTAEATADYLLGAPGVAGAYGREELVACCAAARTGRGAPP